MRKTNVLLIALLSHLICFSQRDSLLVEVRIVSIRLDDDMLTFKDPITVVLSKCDTSTIIALGKVCEKEIGFRIEVLESKIGEESIYVLGTAFFSRKPTGWKLGTAVTFTQLKPKQLDKQKLRNDDDFVLSGGTHHGGTQEFEVDYRFRSYISK